MSGNAGHLACELVSSSSGPSVPSVPSDATQPNQPLQLQPSSLPVTATPAAVSSAASPLMDGGYADALATSSRSCQRDDSALSVHLVVSDVADDDDATVMSRQSTRSFEDGVIHSREVCRAASSAPINGVARHSGFAKMCAHACHSGLHGPYDPQKALQIGGIGFAPVYSELHNYRRKDEKKWVFALMSVSLQLFTGVLTGIFAVSVAHFSTILSAWRLQLTRDAVVDEGCFYAYSTCLGAMTLLAMASAIPVIFWVPSGGSSGIPPIIGLLNGCDLRDNFTWKHFVVKLFGVTCSVASGLVVGPEGPMIFIGACTGALLSNVPANGTVWRLLGRPPNSHNNHVYLRDYVSTGAACGIAAAFRAPIAGAIFVIEEAASHFRREHLAKIFCGGVLAMFVAAQLVGTGKEGSVLFEYRVPTGESCDIPIWTHAAEILIFCFIGLVGGLAGAMFNAINIRAALFRAKYANGTMPFRRLCDVALMCVLTSFCWLALPSLVAEQPMKSSLIFGHSRGCMVRQLEYQVLSEKTVQPLSNGAGYKWSNVPRPCLFGVQVDLYLCPLAYRYANDPNSLEPGRSYANACTNKLIEGTAIETREDKQNYCCTFSSLDSLVRGDFQLPANASCFLKLGEGYPSLRRDDRVAGEDGASTYNPMAALTLVPLAEVAQNLFARGVPHAIPYASLLLYLPCVFLLGALTSGSAIPSGLLLPSIIIGATIGRLIAMVQMDMQIFFGWYGQTDIANSWASAWHPFFDCFGGPLRPNVPMTTTGLLDPGIAAVIGAAAFLGGTSRISLMLTVMMVEITGDPLMIAPVGAATLVAVLVGNVFNHGLYHSLMDVASMPFLPDRWPKDYPKALRVEHLFRNGLPLVVSIPINANRTELEQILHGNSYSWYPVVDPQGRVVGLATRLHLESLLDKLTDTVDVGTATDFNYVTIQAHLPLEVAYNLFKRMEISHLVVVDDGHRPIAMLTRGSFLPWRVEEEIGFNGENHVRSTIQRPRSLRYGLGLSSSHVSTFDDEFLLAS